MFYAARENKLRLIVDIYSQGEQVMHLSFYCAGAHIMDLKMFYSPSEVDTELTFVR